MKKIKYIISVVCLLFLSSCKTTKLDNNSFSFTPDSLPGMTISGIIANEDEKNILYITGVRLFSNWGGGWTEGFFEASGKYVITQYKETKKLTEIDPFELWDITAGEIRYHDTYYRGDDGLWRVKNRVDRLKEITRVLVEDLNFPNKSSDLSKEIYKVLFPELYGFEKLEVSGKLNQKFYDAQLDPETIKNSGINWRTDYSLSVFPEQIWVLRDSGTLYRDVQEAPYIFRALYNLKDYFSKKEITL